MIEDSAPAGTMIVSAPPPLPALFFFSFAKLSNCVPILPTADEEGFDAIALVARIAVEEGREKIGVNGNRCRRFIATELAPLPRALLAFLPTAEEEFIEETIEGAIF